MTRFAFFSSRICLPGGMRRAAVVVENEKIEAIQDVETLDPDISHHDLGDLVISPGIIDAHVHSSIARRMTDTGGGRKASLDTLRL